MGRSVGSCEAAQLRASAITCTVKCQTSVKQNTRTRLIWRHWRICENAKHVRCETSRHARSIHSRFHGLRYLKGASICSDEVHEAAPSIEQRAGKPCLASFRQESKVTSIYIYVHIHTHTYRYIHIYMYCIYFFYLLDYTHIYIYMYIVYTAWHSLLCPSETTEATDLVQARTEGLLGWLMRPARETDAGNSSCRTPSASNLAAGAVAKRRQQHILQIG